MPGLLAVRDSWKILFRYILLHASNALPEPERFLSARQIWMNSPWVPPMKILHSEPSLIPGILPVCPADPPAAAPQPLHAEQCVLPLAPIPEVPFASPPPSPAR